MIENIKATAVTLVGNCYDLHGPDGLCVCCYGRDKSSKSTVLASVNAAASDDDKARIDAAILAVAARGGEFSANDFRHLLPDVSGGVVGARVNALARKHFVHVGYVASTKGNTNGHEIKTWRLRSAVAA